VKSAGCSSGGRVWQFHDDEEYVFLLKTTQSSEPSVPQRFANAFADIVGVDPSGLKALKATEKVEKRSSTLLGES